MSQRQVLQVFEQYEKARKQFVQVVAEFAAKQHHIEALQDVGALSLLSPLLLDAVPAIQYMATVALGRLANFSIGQAEAMVKADILPQLVCSLSEQSNRVCKKATLFVFEAVAKHSPELAKAVVDCGAPDILVNSMEEFDSSVKNSAACALGCIAHHNAELAQAVVDAGAVPMLVLSIQEPEIALKQTAASALCDIARHSKELAQVVVGAEAITQLARLTDTQDTKLKRHVFSALTQIAKHSLDMAELVVETEIFPSVLTSLKDPDQYVRNNVAMLTREITKHSAELSQLVVNAGGVPAIIEYLRETRGDLRVPGIMMLGYVGAHDEHLAMAIIVSKGVPQLAICLADEMKDYVKTAVVWALGQIGCHTPKHAEAVAMANILPELLNLYMNKESSEDLKYKAKDALKRILQNCTYLPVLESFLYDAPSNILKYVLCQYSKVLPHDSKARCLFLSSGGLKKVQEIPAYPGSETQQYIDAINKCYPEEIVRHFSPGHMEEMLKKTKEHQPV